MDYFQSEGDPLVTYAENLQIYRDCVKSIDGFVKKTFFRHVFQQKSRTVPVIGVLDIGHMPLGKGEILVNKIFMKMRECAGSDYDRRALVLISHLNNVIDGKWFGDADLISREAQRATESKEDEADDDFGASLVAHLFAMPE